MFCGEAGKSFKELEDAGGCGMKIAECLHIEEYVDNLLFGGSRRDPVHIFVGSEREFRP